MHSPVTVYDSEDSEASEGVLLDAVRLEQKRREQQRLRMVCYRRKKKQGVADMAQERERLERELKDRVAVIAMTSETPKDTALLSLETKFRQLKVESANLAKENIILRQWLGQHRISCRRIQHNCDEILPELFCPFPMENIKPSESQELRYSSRTILEASMKSAWVAQSRQKVGWCVFFPRGEPSFFFHTFTREEVDAAIRRYEDALEANPPRGASRLLLSWSVHYAPPLRRTQDNAVIAQAKFTTRIRCSLDRIDAVMTSSNIDKWPLLTMPPNWKIAQRFSVSTEVLQEINRDDCMYVMVCNIPGERHTRFFQLTTRQVAVDTALKRSVRFIVVAADSPANSRSRAAAKDPSVRWVVEGGHSIKFTEVDKSTIEIEYDHWAICEGELHARHLYVNWAHYVTTCYWSKLLMPDLLKEV
ncbi:hypothetical protein ON010_g9721 [Phytophthora cinnamomi]|nr:hypothetical protein ON010_g9721 [Phytophthora cinnamomi]